MSEQRFIQSWNMHRGLHYLAIEDTVEKKLYCVEQERCDVEKVVGLLNEQQATIDKQDKAIREALKVLADSKNYQSVISFKYGLQYATKLLKRVIDDE